MSPTRRIANNYVDCRSEIDFILGMKHILRYVFFLISAYSATFGEVKPLKVPTTLSPQGVQVIVERMDDGAREWGLSESLIQSKVEQTLLGFNLEPSDDEPYLKGCLYVSMNLVSLAYSMDVSYMRPVEMPDQAGYLTVEVWNKSFTGISPKKDGSRLLNSVKELTSMFATEYIKQNRKPTQ